MSTNGLSEPLFEVDPIEEIEANLRTLAKLRRNMESQKTSLQNNETILRNRNPEIVEKIEELKRNISEDNKIITGLETAIRGRAAQVPEIARRFTVLSPRYSKVVTVLENQAIHLALTFMPAALEINHKLFDRWALANATNPLVSSMIEVKEIPGFTINSYLNPFYPENDWLAMGLNQDEPPDKLE